MRILVVDDDTNLRTAVRAMLGGTRFEVAEARGGVEAARVFRRSGADLILCDLFMPDGDGLEFLRDLRANYPGVKVVAMSGGGSFHGTIDLLPLATVFGAAGVLHKPFTRVELLAVIGKVLAPALGPSTAGAG